MTIGAIKVGKDRYFWMSYRWSVWLDWLYANDFRKDATPDGIDGEGFAETMDEAIAAAQLVADSVPGPMLAKRPIDRPDAKGNSTISRRYKEVYTRKPPPSEGTTARPIGLLGSLWQRRWNDYDNEGYLGRVSGY
jgi:hypothetical protein